MPRSAVKPDFRFALPESPVDEELSGAGTLITQRHDLPPGSTVPGIDPDAPVTDSHHLLGMNLCPRERENPAGAGLPL